MIDGNRFKTWFQSSGDMPVARKTDFKFSKDNRANNDERRRRKWLLGMQPSVFDSFLHRIRMFLQRIFAGRKTATSSGCVKCVGRQASTTAFEKCESKLSPIEATGPIKAQAFGKKI